MKLLYEWRIPSAGFLIWIVLTLVIVPAFVRHLKKKAETIPFSQPFDSPLSWASVRCFLDLITEKI